MHDVMNCDLAGSCTHEDCLSGLCLTLYRDHCGKIGFGCHHKCQKITSPAPLGDMRQRAKS